MSGSIFDGVAEAMGFVRAGAALEEIKQDNAKLGQQISSGKLRMNPGAANKAAQVYEKKADQVERLSLRASRMGRVQGLGEYGSSQELAGKFTLKAANGTNGAADLLKMLSDELRRKADLFREAAKDYVATDEQIGEDMQKGSQA
ncbi:hypothetical protein [Saccharopolyspora hordei]|uniref:Uncharacterized protein YukE n=1 Tax=Saccharopolyspora hordei TaxID=1838 RepID=A0A853AN69_9PSEU|nr:hypothetical protein [Saccharopolyspora hordei]NYI85306.1 uncharacterized protein YukE [Saccharopolyspora hordei]